MSDSTPQTAQQGLPTLPQSTIWMISFGFLGVQTAFTLQSSQMSRIFQTLGADPHSLGWFFILPPLAGLLVQPIVGHYSDRTWAPRLGGRRLPYLLYGALIAVLVMILMPNSGSFGFGPLAALVFGALMIALLDVSSNMAMQPFKMMVGDMVNDEQKSYAYGIQSFLANAGSVIAAVLPFVFAYIGLANTAPQGVVPQTVVVAFYVGAALLVITSAFTIFKVKEYDPATYARYHGISELADATENRAQGLLDGVIDAVFLLVCLPVFVDVFRRRDCRQCLADHRRRFCRLPRSGQLVRDAGGGAIHRGGCVLVRAGEGAEPVP